MKPTYHIAVSAGLSAGVYAVTHSWPATAGCFFSGVLIDIDHYLEYMIIRKEFPFNYKELVDFCWDRKVKKTYMIFHAYEFLGLFWALIYFLHLGVVWMGIALGFTVHLAFDQFTNPVKPLFYCVTYRMKNNFEKPRLVLPEYYHHA